MEFILGGSAGEMSELLVACRAGDKPPHTGHLPLHRVYSRADLQGLHNWALKSAWRGYLDTCKPRKGIAVGKPAGSPGWQQCRTASELSRATIGKEDELVCFGGRFTAESVLRFHRDRRATLEQLEHEASIEQHMPSRARAAKLREGELSRGVRLVIIDGHDDNVNREHCRHRSPSAGRSPTGSVVVAVHHQSKAIFHTAVTKDQCYVFTALRRAGEEETSGALEPVLHTTAATTLTPIDAPSRRRFLESFSSPTPRVFTVLELIKRRAATRTGCNPSDAENCSLAHGVDDGDNEQSQNLSLDSAILDSASPLHDDESTGSVQVSEANATTQLLGASNDTTANCVDESSSSLAATQSRRVSERARLHCSAYVRSVNLEAFMPAAEPVGSDSRRANQTSGATSVAGVADGDADADAGWFSLLRWRCTRRDCGRQLPVSSSSGGDPVRATRSCDRCGGVLQLSLRDMTMVLSDCPQDCEDKFWCTGKALARSETLTVAVLPCALPSLFCGLVTPERVYGDSEISPHSDDLERAQVREAIWSLCNSGTRLTFELEFTQPDVGSTDSQGYGIEGKVASRGTATSYAVAAIDWTTGFPLDWSCSCTESSSGKGPYA